MTGPRAAAKSQFILAMFAARTHGRPSRRRDVDVRGPPVHDRRTCPCVQGSVDARAPRFGTNGDGSTVPQSRQRPRPNTEESQTAAVARLASLESALEQERSILTAILENTSDAIVAV